MSDDTRIRAIELRLQADAVEEHDRAFADVKPLSGADAGDDADFALGLLAAMTVPPDSFEEIRMRAAAAFERKRAARLAERRCAYAEHLGAPDCECGTADGGLWRFCSAARAAGFR
jgi:hypothetical protein